MKTSPLMIQYIFLIQDYDKAGSDGLFFASDRRLIELSPFLKVLMGLPRSTNEYIESVPRKAFYSFIHGNNSFAIALIPETNFNKEALEVFNIYPLKVLMLRSDLSENTLDVIEKWVNRPLILVESTRFSVYLKKSLKTPILSIEELTLNNFEIELANIVSSLMGDKTYVESLPWGKKQVEILKQFPFFIENQKKSIYPLWPLRSNKIFLPIDLIINRNRGHIDFNEIDFESSEKQWAKEAVSLSRRCFAEMSLMEALAYFENKELDEKGFKFLDVDERSFHEILKGNQEKFDQITKQFSTNNALLQRNHGIILWCPTINPYFHKKIFTVIKEAYRKSFEKRIPDRILNAFLKDTGYKFEFSPKELIKDDQDKELLGLFLGLIDEYAKENSLICDIVTFLSLRKNRPVIKTQKMSSSFFGRMRQLQNLIMQDNQSPKTIQKFRELWKSLRKDITNSVPVEIKDFLRSLPDIPIQFISDLPLEWLEINGTPLMYTHELSRLPVTPSQGLFSHYQVTEEALYISRDFNKPEILLIDGILEGDRVKSITKLTLDLLGKEDFSSIFNISREEINGKEDLFNIIQEKKPLICLIDAHAEYDSVEDIGFLHVGDYKWNPLNEPLPYAPPIIILNSCQTSVVDGTFNTVANGLLGNGVRSIIATLFPISAYIGTFICIRLFANLAAALTGEDKLLTWRTIVSKTIMLNHHLDYLIQFKEYLLKIKTKKISKMDRFPLDYIARWNSEKPFRKHLFEDAVLQNVKEVMKDYGLQEEFDQFMKQRGILPETSFFISLGTPESIFTFDPDRAKNHSDFTKAIRI